MTVPSFLPPSGMKRRSLASPAVRVLALLAIAIMGHNVAPSTFFSSATAAAPTADPAVDSRPEATDAQRERRSPKLGPKFLKVLVKKAQATPLFDVGLNNLEDKYETYIRISGRGEYYPYLQQARKVLMVSGEEENVLSVFEKTYEEVGGDVVNAFFLVPRNVGGQLIGEGGAKIQKMQESTGASIGVNNAGFEQIVDVRGSKQAVRTVAEWLLKEQADFIDTMKEHLTTNYMGGHRRNLDERTSIYITMPSGAAKQLMGRGGEVAMRLQKEFFCSIDIDRKMQDAEGNTIVKLTGAVGDVHALHLHIMQRFTSERKRPSSSK